MTWTVQNRFTYKLRNGLKQEIIDGTLPADEKVYSQYQLAELFNINPATAGKGLTLLLEAEVVYKRRGLGNVCSPDAREKLLTKRKEETLRRLIKELLNEASFSVSTITSTVND